LENIEDFKKLPVFENLSAALAPNARKKLCMFIPYFGDMFDLLGISSNNRSGWIRQFSQNMINDRLADPSGRKSDFLNIMLQHPLTEQEAKTATKVI